MIRSIAVLFLLVWSATCSALTNIEVPLAGCTAISGSGAGFEPYDGPAPADWEQAGQLGCFRFAAAHRPTQCGNCFHNGQVCSSVVACKVNPLVPGTFGGSGPRTVNIQMTDNLGCPVPFYNAGDRNLLNCGCPAGAALDAQGRCFCSDGTIWNPATNSCTIPSSCVGTVKAGVCVPGNVDPGKNCAHCPDRGDTIAGTNPINVGTGMKIEAETYYRHSASQLLSVGTAFFSGTSQAPLPRIYGSFGRNRASLLDSRVSEINVVGGTSNIVVTRGDGRRYEFKRPVASNTVTGDADVSDRLERILNAGGSAVGWKYTDASGDRVESYHLSPGHLLQVQTREGLTLKFSYANGLGSVWWSAGGSPIGYVAPLCNPPAGWVYQTNQAGTAVTPPSSDRLMCVTDQFDRKLHFQTDLRGRIAKIADPEGGIYQFAYDGPTGGCVSDPLKNPACAAGNLTTVTFPDGKTRVYHYNELDKINGGTACSGTTPFSPGRGHLPYHMTGVNDENGVRFSTWTYDCQGRGTSSERAGGVDKKTIAYDTPSAGQRTVTDYRLDANTPNTSRQYSFQTMLGVVRNTSVSEPCNYCQGSALAISYDGNGNIASRTDFNNNRTNYTYDLARNLETSRTEGLTSGGAVTPQTRTITTQWDGTFRLPTAIAEPLRITTNTYDPDGSGCGARGALCSRTIQATTDGSGSQGFSATVAGTPRAWTYTYNTNGSVLTVNGPRTDAADVTAYTYYPNDDADPNLRGNVSSISNALGHTTNITAYNAHGQPLTIVDPNGLTTTLAYDARQRLLSRAVGPEITSYDYDDAGQLTKVILPDGSFLNYGYDAAHRLTSISDNLGNSITYTLDVMGNRTAEQVRDPSNALAQTRSREFNSLNRLFKELGAQNQATEYAYDNQGNVLSVKDPLNKVTSNQYDALNRLKQVTDPGLGVTQYGYNGLDALTSVSDPRSLVTGYAVDGLGNLNHQVSPDTGTTTNTYDAAGNLLTQTDAKGQVTTYAYDALNRVTLITFHDGSKQQYAYDTGANGIGRLRSITELDPANQQTNQTTYAYDQHGRVLSISTAHASQTYTLGYSYDLAGRLSGLTYPSGRTVTYGFDGLGRVSQVTTTKDSQAQIVVQNVEYHPFGGVKGYTLGNGQIYSRSIDLDGRISTYTLGSKTFGIGYDAASRIEQITDLGAPAIFNSYGYDALDRLTSATIPGTPFSYSYDAVGNRTSKTAGAATDTYTYSATSNRIATVGTRSFIFDANGSTTNDGNNTYAYDVRGRMVQATSVVGATNYRVNALGQRIRKTNGLGDTVFHYDTNGKLIAETDPGGGVKREIFYLGDIPVGVVQ